MFYNGYIVMILLLILREWVVLQMKWIWLLNMVTWMLYLGLHENGKEGCSRWEFRDALDN